MKKVHKIIIIVLTLLIILVSILILIFKKDKTLKDRADNVIKCSLNNDYGNYKLNSEYNIYSEDGLVLLVEAIEEITANNKEVLDYQKENMKIMYESSKSLYKGYEINISDNEKMTRFEIKIDYTKMNLDRYLKDQIALKDYYSSGGIQAKGVKIYYESRGAICKES